MPSKIRLQRKGKKGQPFYHIVIADGRAPRDGKLIEKIGTYNPLTKPADITLDFDKALYWLQNGAQPTDTARAILSYQGVMYKAHLLKGVKKGALTEEQAEAKFEVWFREKQEKISNKVKSIELESKNDIKKRLEAERKINEDRAKDIAAKRFAEMKALDAEKAQARKEAEDAQPADESGQEGEGAVEVEATEPNAEVVEEPVAEPEKTESEPTVEEPVAEEPAVEEKAADEKKAEEPVAEEKPTEENKSDEPVAEEKLTEENKSEEPVADEMPAEEPVAEEPAAEDETPEKTE